MTPLTHDDRRALGIRARKQLARSAHSLLDVNACPSDPMAILAESMSGRVESLIPIKYERMIASPFGFFRGAAPIMAADLACHPNTGLITQICGDAHVANLGAYESADGRIVFDINDFDETIRAPFEWDLKRLATSLLLAGREAGIRRADRRAAVATFTARYRRSMREFAEMPVIELARYQIHRLGHIEPMPAIIEQAQRSTPQRILAKLTEPVPAEAANHTQPTASQRRRFRSTPPVLERVQGRAAQKVLDALEQYAETLQPERRHFLSQYVPVDVAFKVVGTGSVGLRDYIVYMEGHARPEHTDPLFLQVKEEPASAYARYLPEGASGHTHQGHRVADGQRALQLTSDPFLGYTTIDNRDYLVRQLNDHKAGLDLANTDAGSLEGYADLCGEVFARGHARAGDPVSIASYLGSGDRFDKAMLEFAHSYADKTERDWNTLKSQLKSRSKPVAAKKKRA